MRFFEFDLSETGPVSAPFHTAQNCGVAGVTEEHGFKFSGGRAGGEDWHGMVHGPHEFVLLSEHRHVGFTVVATVHGEGCSALGSLERHRTQIANRLTGRLHTLFNQPRCVVLHQLLLVGRKRVHGEQIGADHRAGMSVRGGDGNLAAFQLVMRLDRLTDLM